MIQVEDIQQGQNREFTTVFLEALNKGLIGEFPVSNYHIKPFVKLNTKNKFAVAAYHTQHNYSFNEWLNKSSKIICRLNKRNYKSCYTLNIFRSYLADYYLKDLERKYSFLKGRLEFMFGFGFLMNVSEFSNYLQVSRPTVNKLISKGELKPRRVNNVRYIKSSDMLKYLSDSSRKSYKNTITNLVDVYCISHLPWVIERQVEERWHFCI